MVTFVPNEQEVDLQVEISGPNSESIQDFEFIFTRASDGKQVEKVSGTVNAKRMGSGTWTAKGLEGTELSARINWEAKAGGLPALGRGEIVVYHDEIEVVTKDDEGNAVEQALVHVDVRPDPLYRGTDMTTDVTRRTDGTGKVVFDALPPGEVEISIRTPYTLLEWVTEEGSSREAKVEKNYRAKLIWPDPNALNGDDHHEQYVNMATDPGHPEQGSAMKIKVAVEVDPPEVGTTGDKLYVKVKFGANNSPRNDTPKPMFGANEGGAGKGPFVVEKALTADDQTVEFDLELGAAGGDEVTISVGGDDQCTDETVKVVSWRKLWIKPVIVQGFPLPNNQIHQEIKDKIDQTLVPSFIKTEFEPALQVVSSHTQIVDGQRARQMNLRNPNRAPFVCFSSTGPEKEHYNVVVSDNPLRLYWFLGHVFYSSPVEQFILNFRGRTSAWVSSPQGNSFFPISPSGDSVLHNWREASAGRIHKHSGKLVDVRPVQASYWEKVDDSTSKGAITIDHLHFDRNKRRFYVKLPGDLGIGRRDQIRVSLKLSTFSTVAGSSTGNWVAGAYEVDTPRGKLSTLYTILHELGHSIGQCASDNAAYPGLPAEHPHHYTGKGHMGPHCNFGLSARNAAKDSYQPLVLKGTHGNCIMFGGIGPKTKLAKAMKFCKHCTPFVKAANFTSL